MAVRCTPVEAAHSLLCHLAQLRAAGAFRELADRLEFGLRLESLARTRLENRHLLFLGDFFPAIRRIRALRPAASRAQPPGLLWTAAHGRDAASAAYAHESLRAGVLVCSTDRTGHRARGRRVAHPRLGHRRLLSRLATEIGRAH